MHLALAALEARRSDEALVYLKRAIAVEPNNARLHYLLGAVHAVDRHARPSDRRHVARDELDSGDRASRSSSSACC